MVAAGMEAPNPLLWAGYAAGGYYALLIVFVVTANGGFII